MKNGRILRLIAGPDKPAPASSDYADVWGIWVSPIDKRANHSLAVVLRKQGRYRTLKDMTELEIQALEQQYGCTVRRYKRR